MSPRLPALMDVLDRADAAETLNREQLLQAAQDLGTHHSPAALATAVDAHLAETVPAVAPLEPAVPFKWRWPRPTSPTSPADLADRLAASMKWAWADTAQGIRRHTHRAQMSGVGVGALVGVGLILGVAHMTDLNASFTVPIGLIFGAVGGWMGDLWSGRMLQRAYFQRQRYLPFTGDLAYKEWVYLDLPETRDYLRAVLTSPVPDLLRSDARLLNNLAYSAIRKRREAEQKEAEDIRARRQAEKEQAKKNRLGRFARALNGDPSAIQDEPTEEVSMYD